MPKHIIYKKLYITLSVLGECMYNLQRRGYILWMERVYTVDGEGIYCGWRGYILWMERVYTVDGEGIYCGWRLNPSNPFCTEYISQRWL